MNTIDLTVPESEAKRFENNLKEEIEEIQNVLESFRENDLEHTEPYRDLKQMKENKQAGVEMVHDQIEEQMSEKRGLEELFG